MDVLRVLVVDDSLIIRAMVEQLVQRQPGCRVVGVAPDVATAIRMIEELRPNVMTLDLAMPGASGLSLLDTLKDSDHAPIVVLSSSTRDGSIAAQEVMAHGAAGYFDKTRLLAEADRFIRVLRKAVERKKRRSAVGRRAA
jgi:chemotaxis response regulator CheB